MGSSTYGSRSDSVNITDAHTGASADLKSREKRYGITMAFRVACFIAMIWVPNPYRFVLLGAAAVLPYIAVIIANQADQRRQSPEFERGGPTGGPELTDGHTSLIPWEEQSGERSRQRPGTYQPGSWDVDDETRTSSGGNTQPHGNGRPRD